MAVVKQAELGVPVGGDPEVWDQRADLLYRWKKQYVGMETDQARQMKQLQEENSRLKQLVADLSLDKTMLQDVLRKKSSKAPRGAVRWSIIYATSIGRAARLPVLLMVRGTYRYQSHQEPWTELRMRIREIAQSRVRYGYRKIRVLLNREGWDVGKYLVYRVCKEEGLALKGMNHTESGEPCGIRRKGSRPQGRIRLGASTSLRISCRMALGSTRWRW